MATPNPGDRSRYFFKIFFPDYSSNRLTIPKAFQEHIEGEIEPPKNVWLKGPSGKVWEVSLARNSNTLCFEDGWEKFVTDHSVAAGDFLVFQYDGRSRFTVMVFDSTACEKEGAFDARPCQEGNGAVEVSEEEEEVEDDLLTRKGLFKNLSKNWGNHSRSKSRKAKSSPGGRRGNRTAHSINVSRHSEFAKSSEMHRKGEVIAKKSRIGMLISQRRPVTDDEVNSTLQRALSFKSTNPYVVVVMRKSYVYRGFAMGIPSHFVREHLPKHDEDITLWNPNRKQWKITYLCYGTHGCFSGGWGQFSFGNNLEEHDVCVFECIKETELLVHIFRVVEEITPFFHCKK